MGCASRFAILAALVLAGGPPSASHRSPESPPAARLTCWRCEDRGSVADQHECARNEARLALRVRPPRLAEAVACATLAKTLDPIGAGVWASVVQGLALEVSGQGAQAAVLYAGEAARRSGAASWPAHFALGSALVRGGAADRALLAFSDAVRAQPGSADAFLNAGNALAALPGRRRDAARAYATALRLLPSLHDARCNLLLLNGAADCPPPTPPRLATYAALSQAPGGPWQGWGEHAKGGGNSSALWERALALAEEGACAASGGRESARGDAECGCASLGAAAADALPGSEPGPPAGAGARAAALMRELRFEEAARELRCAFRRVRAAVRAAPRGAAFGALGVAWAGAGEGDGGELGLPELCALIEAEEHLGEWSGAAAGALDRGAGAAEAGAGAEAEGLMGVLAGLLERALSGGEGAGAGALCPSPLLALFYPLPEAGLLRLARAHAARLLPPPRAPAPLRFPAGPAPGRALRVAYMSWDLADNSVGR